MRALSRLLAALLGIILLAGGIVVALEIGLTAVARRSVLLPYDDWLADGRRYRWDDSGIEIASLVVLAVGVLLLVVTLRRRKPKVVAATAPGDVRAALSRRPLEAALRRYAMRISGVERVKVRVRKKAVTVSGGSLDSDLDRASQQLAEGLAAGLGRLPLATPPKVDVHLKRAKS